MLFFLRLNKIQNVKKKMYFVFLLQADNIKQEGTLQSLQFTQSKGQIIPGHIVSYLHRPKGR